MGSAAFRELRVTDSLHTHTPKHHAPHAEVGAQEGDPGSFDPYQLMLPLVWGQQLPRESHLMKVRSFKKGEHESTMSLRARL